MMYMPTSAVSSSSYTFGIITSLKRHPTLLSILSHSFSKDFSHVIGHAQATRALEISAAGEHNVLKSDPPDAGKVRWLGPVLRSCPF